MNDFFSSFNFIPIIALIYAGLVTTFAVERAMGGWRNLTSQLWVSNIHMKFCKFRKSLFIFGFFPFDVLAVCLGISTFSYSSYVVIVSLGSRCWHGLKSIIENRFFIYLKLHSSSVFVLHGDISCSFTLCLSLWSVVRNFAANEMVMVPEIKICNELMILI